ncbi:MAG: alpha/beta fold hydrolase [Patescibacteria group bacterium]|nr:alpha/beta fold hydrolase [Patescibacteria group bacterium]
MSNVSEKEYDIGNAKIHTITYGKGKPLLLIPAWPYSGRIYLVLKELLENHFKVTSLDLPGWSGESHFTKDTEPTVDTYIKIVRDTIHTIYPDNDSTSIGGVSFGGSLALLASLDKTINIKKVIAISSPYNGSSIINAAPILSSILCKTCENGVGFTPLMVIHGVASLLLHTRHISNDLRVRLSKDYLALSPQTVGNFAYDFFRQDFETQLNSLTNETVIVGATNDHLVPSRTLKKLAEEVIPKAKYYEMDGANHSALANEKYATQLAGILIQNHYNNYF